MTLEPRGSGSRRLAFVARVLPASTVLAVVVAVAEVWAEDTDSFQWSATRRLTWDDFAGAVTREDGSERIAATTASIAWSYDFRVRMAGADCTYTLTAIDSAAHFHPAKSWVDPGHENAAVLAHEQGHFDIAELYSREFKTVTRDLIGTGYGCRAGLMGRATRDAEAALAGQLGAIYDQVWGRYRARQQAYDGDTRHGTDTDAQSRWDACIAVTLGSGPGCWAESARLPGSVPE